MRKVLTAQEAPIAAPRVAAQAGTLRFDLRGLEVYLAVCDAGSMTVAARLLGLTQPAVSQIIRQLEFGLGVQLIDRKLRPLGITPAGVMLRQRGRELLAEAREVLPAVQQSRKAKLPLIRVGLVDSFAIMFGPPLANSLRPLASQLSIWSGLAHAHGNALLNRQVDLIVTTDALEDVEGFKRYLLLEEPFILAVPTQWRGRAKANLQLAQLAAEMPLVRYSARSHIGMQVDRHLRRLNIEVPRTFEFDVSDGIVAMVAEGLGWAITTPLCVLGARLPLDRIALIPLPSPGATRQLVLVARSGELGRLPAHIAGLARRILNERLIPKLNDLLPGIADQIRIG